ncbi:glycosyltransferase family 2 protein [Bacteroides mediterraneensis]|uniref:glycosyltransferase family 2 protein n=1 Tax=Bacteroides mediterraneensis TaxID=1841856 RepID=UPI0026ECE808|nr:glycosyltransferase family 2 protein [Bacteroides mediterraneensis]
MNPKITSPIIGCAIVTYNRLNLLKENISALKQQTYSLHKIFIIDNCSTDGTKEYLDSLSNDPQMQIIHLSENKGGAWGFYEGIKQAVLAKCEYVWIMDDDTIPTHNALTELVKGLSLSDHIGFVCSKVTWTDGSPHKMNKPGLIRPIQKITNPDDPSIYGMSCTNCTFVSVMFDAKAIYQVGLPLKEFFIWHDDIEYTDRIIKAGYKGYYIEKSVVVHKTGKNYAPHIEDTPQKDLWKFYYQARNTTFMARKNKPNKLIFYLSILNKYRRYMRKIRKIKDKECRAFIKKEVKRGCQDGLKFNPKIENIKPQ